MSSGKLTRYKMLTVYCRCGQKLVRYRKGAKGKGRLIKIHRDRIEEDFTGIFLNNYSEENTDIFCPSCNGRIATVKCLRGKYVNKLNQGMIGTIKK